MFRDKVAEKRLLKNSFFLSLCMCVLVLQWSLFREQPGYGDVACNTPFGRLMTVIYAIVGIPLMLITLNDLGKFLYKTINNIVRLVRLKSRISRIFGTKLTHKTTTLQQNNSELAQLEAGTFFGCTGSGLENGTENNDSKRIKFHLSIDLAEESLKEEETATLSLDDAVPISAGPPPRIPVLVAVGITVSWIFLCAALFKIWEHDWTYAESCYFMFISLSTIGLGDLSVRRRDLMVLCFIFVIIGLSMVSMCINVIQASLEDLYVKILMKLIVEYQSKLAQGDDRMAASMSMMQMWGSNKTAKYLMPLLSKNKRITAMAKVQEDAEAQGIKIPPIFSDIDQESGMPKLFAHAGEEFSMTEAIEEAIHRVDTELPMQAVPPAPPPPPEPSPPKTVFCDAVVQTDFEVPPSEPSPPKTVFYDAVVQTDFGICSDKAEQTSIATLVDTAIVTEPIIKELLDAAVQCQEPVVVYGMAQTEVSETNENECMTVIPEFMERLVQTEEAVLLEQEIQTHLFDALEIDTQTEIHEYVTQYTQTPFLELVESEAQTESMEELKPQSRTSRAKEQMRRAFSHSKSLQGHSGLPPMSEWTDPKEDEQEEEEEEDQPSSESLDWDPIDGMHAEKQRPVRDLTKFFEVKSQGKRPERSQSIHSSSQASSRSSKVRTRTSPVSTSNFQH